jgi:glycosyltransferase involved in cell wall biosynthesis
VVPVKVLHVVEAIEGGIARHIVSIVRHVDAEHFVVVPPERVGGITDTTAFGAMADAGATVELVDMRRSPTSRRTIAAISRVHAMVRRVHPDVVHGHSSIGGAVARLASVGTGVARVYTPNGLFPTRAAYAVERALGRLTDRLIAASPSEAELVRRHRLVPPERIVVIPNGVDLEHPGPGGIDVRVELGVGPTVPVVGTVSRLVPQKAPEIFVRACALIGDTVPDARFVLVGDGPLLEHVRSEVASARLDDRLVVLRGRSDAPALVTQFDVFMLSSRYEGGPYILLDAMRAGVPVVVTDVVGNRDAVEDGRSGFVVAPEDPEALAGAVTRLLLDAGLRRRVGDAGRARVAARFELRCVSSALTDLYWSLHKAGSSRAP